MATKTINDLYLKYVNKVGRTLENDRYFQYLYEMVQAGENVLQQNNQVLHKVVDERWLSTIEESLDSINKIIENPRRFVTTKEEVVPVALAKKITADSVRHLSMNTQFIASDEDGEIQPTRILNVSTEESYDLYENRFVYHLIQRLVTFIDKRTDVIFWSTGDETQNVLSYQSKVDDAYEEIEYKIEMKIKNRQSFAENDADNMNVFMRIDRVRRMVIALKNSSFCSLMAGCAKVRSPIQRTNLIMKDPDYRTCYKLWQFLESYDEVGYSIEVENEALSFDEEYLIQMYTNLITNYTVFKSLLEEDSRKVDEPLAKKRRVIKPKFIKKIKEEIVDDYNIEDVEIRQVIIEEVTQAQLDAEARLEEEIEARRQAQEALEEMDSQMVFLQQQVSNLMMMNQEAEVRAAEEQAAKEQALAEIETVREQSLAEIEAVKKQERAEKEETERRARTACAQAEEARAEAQQRMEETQKQLEEYKEQTRQKTEQLQKEAQQKKEKAEYETARIKKQLGQEILETKKQLEESERRARTEKLKDIAEKKQAAKAYKEQKQQDDAQIERLSRKQSELERLLEEANQAKARLEQKLALTEQEVQDAKARELAAREREQAANERADANTLSHYIIAALNERKRRNEAEQEDKQDDE